MIARHGTFFLKMLSTLVTLLVLLLVVITYGPKFESRNVPVMKEWNPQSVEVDGLDVIVTGMVIKTRGCKYAPPPRARDMGGRHYTVVSTNTSAKVSWAPNNTPQVFGPWRVIGGRGVDLEMYQEHECHSMWPTFSILGRISTPPMR